MGIRNIGWLDSGVLYSAVHIQDTYNHSNKGGQGFGIYESV